METHLSKVDLERFLSGDQPLPDGTDDGADDSAFVLAIEQAAATRTCPRDGLPLGDRDNPRNPGLNRELFCSCGFAVTT